MCRVAFLVVTTLALPAQETDRNFAGVWLLNSGRSEQTALPFSPEQTLRISQTSTALTLQSEHGARTIATTGQSSRQTFAGVGYSTITKWEGQALLINSLSTSGRNYALTDRWRLSRDGGTLTIRRVYSHGGLEHESTLVYEREGWAKRTTAPTPEAPPQAVLARRMPESYTVEAGTPVVVRVISPVNTRSAAAGDKVYFETAMPVAVQGSIVVAAGSQVTATIAEVNRAGRAGGRAELILQFDGITLANGAHREIRSRVSSADGRPVTRDGGTIQGESGRASDARKVGEAASAGANAGRYGGMPGVGAAAGAAAGLAGVLVSRGPDVLLERGATLELVLDRSLTYSGEEIRSAPR
jgi:type IV secretion system protein VirB10